MIADRNDYTDSNSTTNQFELSIIDTGFNTHILSTTTTNIETLIGTPSYYDGSGTLHLIF